MKTKILNFWEWFSTNISKWDAILGIYFAVWLVLGFNPIHKDNISINSFNRTFGKGVSANWDCAKVVKDFYLWFILFGLICIMITALITYIKSIRVDNICKKAWEYLDLVLPIAYISLVLKCINFFKSDAQVDTTIFDFTSNLMFTIILLYSLYILLKLYKLISFVNFQWFSIILLGISFPMAVKLTDEWKYGKTWFKTYMLLMVISFIVMFLFKKFVKKEIDAKAILYGSSLFGGIFLFTSIFFESINVLNQHNVFVKNPSKWYLLLVLLMAIMGIIGGLHYHRKPRKINWKRTMYPISLFGLACISVSLPLSWTGGTELFESANYSVLINDFLNFGDIPIIQHYGGHMLQGVISGILYGVINNDYSGAVFSPYMVYIYAVVILIMFYLLKYLLNEDSAFWFVLVLPFYDFITFFGIGFLVCVTLCKYIKKKSYINGILLWVSCAIVALYRLDLGVAFGIAVLLALVIYTIAYKDYKNIKKLLVPFVAVCSLGVITFISLCLLKSINPITRLKEFIYISASNQNWSRAGIGEIGNMVFSWSYIFIPFSCVGCLVYFILNKRLREKVGPVRFTVIVMIGLIYFANFSRGCVRHSLEEMILSLVIFSAYLFLALFLSCVIDWKGTFIVAYMGFMIINHLFGTDINYSESSLLNRAMSNSNQFFDGWVVSDYEKKENPNAQTMWQQINQKVQRVTFSEDINNRYTQTKRLTEVLLKEDETWIDLVNQSTLYSMLKRESPVYVSQSPGQLSGEYTQIDFINEINENKDKIPLVFLPNANGTSPGTGFDGIANSYRYYKVFEYIYKNYEPLCQYSDICVWCKPEDKSKYLLKIKGNSSLDYVSLADYGYDTGDIPLLHNYSLGYIPYVWANFDPQESGSNTQVRKLTTADNGVTWKFDGSSNIDKKLGNYLIFNSKYDGLDARFYEKNDDEENELDLQMGTTDEYGNFEKKYTYQVTIKEGKSDYMIRLSNDYFWYVDNINTVVLSSKNKQEIKNMRILEGD